GASFANAALSYQENKLLSALESGWFKSAAAETRRALAEMERCFTVRYGADGASEMDGWIYGAIMSGGKRLRPMLVRLCAGFGNGGAGKQASAQTGGQTPREETVISIMSSIELIHSASLVHDDIVDRSPLRRSHATINAAKGDGYAAMCGFAMISDALGLIGDDCPERIPEIIAAIPMRMCDGELRQFDVENKPERQSESEYFRRIAGKTAVLIEGSCVCGAVCGGASAETERCLAEYGRALGMLFQLRDDLLDYEAGPADGKPVSQDMERGLYSLPLLYARRFCAENDPAEAARLDAAMRKQIKSPADLRYLASIAEKSGGIAYTRGAIGNEAGKAFAALSALPQGPYAEALALLVTALAGTADARRAPEGRKVVRLNHDRP
ncbi:MAG: polyprenyl synthetase family protein, partial [Clostridiales Family XIII bacterium]|nr:polyprenyl synthetase family protein [Clostridiales Family XIII bacterium]